MNEQLSIAEKKIWKDKLICGAKSLGFIGIGFTHAEPLKELEHVFKERQLLGLDTPFEAKDIEQRINPRKTLENCETVAVLAYPLPLSSPPLSGEGVFSRSAVGTDYHVVVKERINELIQLLKADGWPGRSYHVQVDSGPLNERGFAVRSGLGWIGKNQQLIIPQYGSFVSLGLLLLDQELPADSPVKNQCGNCQACIKACPAQILGSDRFPAKSCISYLTQTKEFLEPYQTVQMGSRLFGCDSCQEACPHNQKIIRAEKLENGLKIKRGADLLKILSLSKKEFNEHYRGTAAGWRGKGILQRNAFIAMVNSNDHRIKEWIAEQEKIPPLVQQYLNTRWN